MTDEEKKSIKNFKKYMWRLMNTVKEIAMLEDFRNKPVEKQYNKCNGRIDDIKTILNLIEKQQKEIEDKQDEINVLEAQNESIENQFEQAKKEIERLKFFQCNVKCMNRRKSESEK